MDPYQVLFDCTDAVNEGYYVKAISKLNDYYQWRLKGGFEPTVREKSGDAVADEIANTLIDKMQQ